MKKQEMLKARVIECHARLGKLIEHAGSPVIIGAAAWHLFCTVLAAYGTSAGMQMITSLRDGNLRARGVCVYGDCVASVKRDRAGICARCSKSLDAEMKDTSR